MAENDNQNENSNAEQQAPAIIINTQYIKDLSLEIPFAPEIFKELTSAPDININVDVKANNIENNVFNVNLNISMDGNINTKKLFILELEYACVVTLNIPQEHLEPVLLIEIPRMLFPFARSIITNTLVDGGLPPFMINPIDFGAMFNNRKPN